MFWKPSASERGNLEMTLQISQFYVPPGFIDLGLGDPQFSLLPLDYLRRAAEECLGQNNPEFLQYGTEQGAGTFRHSLAEFLSRRYAYPMEPDSLFITNGASMGLHLICTLFTRPGDTIFVEDPTYFLALRIFSDHELSLVPIRTDNSGLVIESLEEKLAESRPKFLYIIPTFQNPTGHTLSAERRQQLVSLSRKHDFLVVADEVYHFLSYASLPPKPFAADTSGGNVISLGSFSKILAPGLRLGWIQANGEIIHRFVKSGLLDSGGGMNPFTSAIVCRVLENGTLDQNIARLIATYRARIAVMDAALRRHLPDMEYTLPQGGYFFWIRLPNKNNASALQQRAEIFKVGFRPGVLFSCQGGMQNYIRLSYVFYEPDELEQGVLRLKQSLDIMEY
jgi:DNA-binding transcriptional MocR family regulator